MVLPTGNKILIAREGALDADKIVAGIEKFFFDIVGSIIPGSLLIAGVRWTVLKDVPLAQLKADLFGDWFLLALAYVAGQGLATLGELTLVRLAPRLAWVTHWLTNEKKRTVISRDDLYSRISKRSSFQTLGREVLKRTELGSDDVHELRNAALTMLTAEEKATMVRFMFLSILSLGVATDIILIGILYVVRNGVHSSDWPLIPGILLLTAIFMVRHFEFFRRAMQTPFDIAVAKTPKVTA